MQKLTLPLAIVAGLVAAFFVYNGIDRLAHQSQLETSATGAVTAATEANDKARLIAEGKTAGTFAEANGLLETAAASTARASQLEGDAADMGSSALISFAIGGTALLFGGFLAFLWLRSREDDGDDAQPKARFGGPTAAAA